MYNHLNKETNLIQLNNYIYSKTLSMFDYTGLPDSIPEIEIEKILQRKGYGVFHEVNGELYIFHGTFTGEQDAYDNYKKIRIDNVPLKYHKDIDFKTDGILIRNDDMMNGLEPLINRINSLLIENEITMYLDNYNSRISTLLSAGDEPTRESAENFLEKIKKGELGIIGESQVLEGIKAHNTKAGTQNTITQLIELNQYLKANLYNELGLDANYNMKRERLNTSEVAQNDDALHPFIDNMLACRKKAIEQLNEKYGLSVGVEFGSIWERKKSDIESVEEVEPVEEKENVSRETNGVTIESLVLNITPSEIVVPDEREEVEDITEEEIQEEIEVQEGGEENDVQRVEEE